MTLATDEFIRRFLIHVLPKGLHRIRHYTLKSLMFLPVFAGNPRLNPRRGPLVAARYGSTSPRLIIIGSYRRIGRVSVGGTILSCGGEERGRDLLFLFEQGPRACAPYP